MPFAAFRARSPSDRFVLACSAYFVEFNPRLPDMADATAVRAFHSDNPFDRLDKTYFWQTAERAPYQAVLRDWWDCRNGQDARETMEWLNALGHRAEMPQTDHPDLAKVGYLGWDLMRTGTVARLALLSGYLNAADVLPYLRAAARLLQAHCPSWNIAALSFMEGMWEWSGNRAGENRYEAAFGRLLSHPLSPWRQVDFKTPLSL